MSTQHYDFYASPTATATAPGAPAGTPAPAFGSGGAVNQFGTPLGTPGATLPASAAAAAAPARRAAGTGVPGWVWRVGAGLAVAVVLGLFGVGKLGFLDLFGGPLEAPATLGGMPAVAESSPVRAALAPVTAMMQAEVGEDAVVQVYTDEVSAIGLLVAARGEEDVEEGAASLAAAGFTASDVDGYRCAVNTTDGTSTCLTAQDGLTVVVLLSGTDPSAAAALVTEALAQLD